MIKDKKAPQIRFKNFNDDWEQCKLGKIYSFQYGEFNNNPDNGGIYPIYGANGIIGGYTKYNAKDSVIIGHMGEYAGSVLWGKGKHFVTYNGTISRTKNDSILSRFGYYMLLQKNINKICGGSGLPFLSYEQLNKIHINFSSNINEQFKIVEFLTSLDNLITLHQRKVEKLEIFKKAMLEKMFPKTGEKVPEIRFKNFTADWEQCKLMYILETLSFRTFIKEPERGGIYEIIQQGDDPIIRFANGNPCLDYKDIVIFGDHTLSLYKPKSPFFIATDGVRIIRGKRKIYGYYLLNILRKYKPKSEGYKRYFGILKNTNCYFTKDIKEQNKIGNLFKQLDNLITLHQREVENLKIFKEAMLEKMFV